jgi:chromosome segregation ATPase
MGDLHGENAVSKSLAGELAPLRTQVKSRQNLVKRLESEVAIARAETEKAIAKVQADAEVQKAELVSQLVPLKEAKEQLLNVRFDLEQAQQALKDEKAALLADRAIILGKLDAEIKAKEARLAAASPASVTRHRAGVDRYWH